MAKMFCAYCGGVMDEAELFCPGCGKKNISYKEPKLKPEKKRGGDPGSIEELRQWYSDRNLPPEEVTRFFIGKDIREPKAFGIFCRDGIYTVYKNKADGSRVVRYQGKGEAYAVHEFYRRLQKEILNQKGQKDPLAAPSAFSRGSQPAAKTRRRWPAFLGVLLAVIGLTAAIGSYIQKETSAYYSYKYFLTPEKEIWYNAGSQYTEEGEEFFEWWKFDRKEKEWFLAAKLQEEKEHPAAVNLRRDVRWISDICEAVGLDYEELSIYRSRAFIDAGHHYKPSGNSYYYAENKLYYYLDDNYGGDYADGDDSGWYFYEDGTGWSYLCDWEDRETLNNDSLWYAEDDYYLGIAAEDIDWSMWYAPGEVPDRFEGTSWYSSMLLAEQAHGEYMAEWESSSSDDSWDSYDSDSYDWDSSDSWDSSSTDWDSDW